jgi:hypothetical protein
MEPEPFNPGIYDDRFFENVAEGSRCSAAVVVPVIVDLFRPVSVVDVGCADGFWLEAFALAGLEDLLGIDGPWLPPERRPFHFCEHDLCTPFRWFDSRFDLVVSLEVAEHLPESAADVYLNTLATLGDRVLFSAAVPGQGGHGHINEKPAEWWQEKFAARGFARGEAIGQRFAGDSRVDWWYSRNMVIYSREAAR